MWRTLSARHGIDVDLHVDAKLGGRCGRRNVDVQGSAVVARAPAFTHPAHQLAPAPPTDRVRTLLPVRPKIVLPRQATSMPAQSRVVWVRQRQSHVAEMALSRQSVLFATFNHPVSQPNSAGVNFSLFRLLFVIRILCFCHLCPAHVSRPVPYAGGCCVHAPVVSWNSASVSYCVFLQDLLCCSVWPLNQPGPSCRTLPAESSARTKNPVAWSIARDSPSE
jgi:hypothetical protein